MADNKDQTNSVRLDKERLSIAERMAELSQNEFSRLDRRLMINQKLINQTKELAELADEFNKHQKDTSTTLGRLTSKQKDYSEEIKKAAATEEALQKRKVDLTKRAQEIRDKIQKRREERGNMV